MYKRKRFTAAEVAAIDIEITCFTEIVFLVFVIAEDIFYAVYDNGNGAADGTAEGRREQIEKDEGDDSNQKHDITTSQND